MYLLIAKIFEEIDRLLDNNLSFGIGNMEECSIEHCEYIRQYEDQAFSLDWFTAKYLLMSILSHGQDTKSYTKL